MSQRFLSQTTVYLVISCIINLQGAETPPFITYKHPTKNESFQVPFVIAQQWHKYKVIDAPVIQSFEEKPDEKNYTSLKQFYILTKALPQYKLTQPHHSTEIPDLNPALEFLEINQESHDTIHKTLTQCTENYLPLLRVQESWLSWFYRKLTFKSEIVQPYDWNRVTKPIADALPKTYTYSSTAGVAFAAKNHSPFVCYIATQLMQTPYTEQQLALSSRMWRFIMKRIKGAADNLTNQHRPYNYEDVKHPLCRNLLQENKAAEEIEAASTLEYCMHQHYALEFEKYMYGTEIANVDPSTTIRETIENTKDYAGKCKSLLEYMISACTNEKMIADYIQKYFPTLSNAHEQIKIKATPSLLFLKTVQKNGYELAANIGNCTRESRPPNMDIGISIIVGKKNPIFITSCFSLCRNKTGARYLQKDTFYSSVFYTPEYLDKLKPYTLYPYKDQSIKGKKKCALLKFIDTLNPSCKFDPSYTFQLHYDFKSDPEMENCRLAEDPHKALYEYNQRRQQQRRLNNQY